LVTLVSIITVATIVTTIPVLTRAISNVVQIGSGTHPTSYLMGTGGSFPGGKATGA
jgi:hypothetical protein